MKSKINILFMALCLNTGASASEVWGHIKGFGHVKSNDSLYVDRLTEEFSQFGFDLEVNRTLFVPRFYLTLGAEGNGKATPGFTKVAGRAQLTLDLNREVSIYAYHRSAHNLDRNTRFKTYGFSNDNQIGLKIIFGKRSSNYAR